MMIDPVRLHELTFRLEFFWQMYPPGNVALVSRRTLSLVPTARPANIALYLRGGVIYHKR